MPYSFKGTCVKNSQSSVGSHVGLLEGPGGEQASIPSTDMLLVVGKTYTVTVDGEFAPKPKPVEPPKPEPPKPPVVAKPEEPKPVPAA